MGKWDNDEPFDDAFLFPDDEDEDDVDDEDQEDEKESSDDILISLEIISEFLPHSSLEIEEALTSGEIDEALALDIADAVRRFRERVID